jgi:preprotein translocase SecF subunit
MRLFKNANIPFVKLRKISYVISGILMLVSLIALIANGLNWSVDFTSGVSAKLNLKAKGVPALRVGELRSVLSKNGFPDADIQNIGEADNALFLIKLKSKKDTDEVSGDVKDRIIQIIQTNFPKHVEGRDMRTEVVEEFYVVGPKVGGELRSQALIAVIVALILMIIYIWFRFELTFGVIAILALFHNVFITIGAFALTGKEMTFQIIAALLTIVGYSINNTIVIFDRIREELRLNRGEPLPPLFDRAINATLSRTIITTLTTLFSSLALLFFGGSVLHDFAFAMTLGVILGTFSSIFIASPLVLDIFLLTGKEKKSVKKLTKKKR